MQKQTTLTPIHGAKGVRNDVAYERLGAGELAYARNVDIDKTGRVHRRAGTALVAAGAAHSAWSDGAQGYFVQGGNLKRLDASGAITSLCAVAGTRVCYVGVNGLVFWSDGLASGCIVEGANQSWGMAPPAMVVPQSGLGALPVGNYLCTLTFVDAEGRESGAPRASSTLSQGALVFSGLPVSADPRVVRKNLYVSAPNGDLPLLTATLDNATTSLSIIALPAQTLACRTQFQGPPPAGTVLGCFNGRVYVGMGAFLFYSQPWEFELFDLRSGFIAFESEVQTFAAVTDGVFVGTTGRTVFLAGAGPESFAVRGVSNVGTVLGTEQLVSAQAFAPGSEVVNQEGKAALWMSRQGLVAGFDGGLSKDLTCNHFNLPTVSAGGALVKRRDGTRQYLVALQG